MGPPRARGPEVVARGCVFSVSAGALFLACQMQSSPPRPDDLCVHTCVTTIPQCTETGCTRGCQLSLDRLIEPEGDHVLACVRKGVTSAAPNSYGYVLCDDALWASCAARIGPHADGGPPAPVSGPRR
jgi:hypothetical protein